MATEVANPDVSRLTTFQHHIDDMRNLVMCKICLKPLYEPFILACGHTYCYGCLRSWFTGLNSRGRKKNCPDCRAIVELAPSPNYILRDLVHMFINRAELLPEDETVDEHVAGRIAEADVLAGDKEGAGLFLGIFATPTHDHHGVGGYGPHWDPHDRCWRCPECNWELEDGMCNGCGWIDESEDNPDFSSDMDDESIDLGEGSIASDNVSSEDGYISDNGRRGFPRDIQRDIHRDIHRDLPRDFYRPRVYPSDFDPSTATDVDSELDYGSPHRYDNGLGYDMRNTEDEMEDFIDDYDGDEPSELDEDDMIGPAIDYLRRARRAYRIPDEDDEDAEDEEDSMDEAENNYRWRPGGPIETSELSDSEEENGSQHDDDNEDQHTNYDESESERRSVTPLAMPVMPRRRPRVVSDDDDDDDDDEGEGGANEVESRTEGRGTSEDVVGGGGDDSDSNDTATPPQPSLSRRQRLDDHRKRRRTPENSWRNLARREETSPRRQVAGRAGTTSTRQARPAALLNVLAPR